MCRYERPEHFRRNGRGFERKFVVRPTVLLPLLVAYGLGFFLLYPLVQASASRSAADGNDPMAFVGP